MYDFHDLSKKVKRVDTGEVIVDQLDIEDAGIMCKPFWESTDDIEGDSYKKYIRNNPDFSLSIRKSVLKMLIEAQTHLPEDWIIVLKAGYRPLEVQKSLFKQFIQKAQADNPNWDKSEARKHASLYVSDPDDHCPPHTTGGAVDVDILNITTGKYVDMGTTVNEDNHKSFLFNDDISQEQHNNRLVLLSAMLRVGFAPLATEWWHYQYGESLWAAFYGKEITLYDTI